MVAQGYKDTEIGVIPVEWEVVELGSILTIKRGASPRPINKFITESKNAINWIKIGDIQKNVKYITKTKQRITNKGAKKSRAIQPKDFVLSNSMSFGRPYISKIYGCIHDGWLLLRNKDENILSNNFLYEVLSGDLAKKQFKKFAAGSTVNNLKSETVSTLNFPLPPLKEQEKIANILSTADDKISAIASQIEKAQTLKKGLLQKLLSEGIGHSEFKDSELGKIPVGWEIGKLEDILTIKYGKSQKDVEDLKGEYPILGTGGIMGYANDFLCDKPSVLIGRKGTIDKPQYMEKPFWTVDTLFFTELKENIYPKFVYYIFQTINWRKYNEASGVPSLSKPNIHNIATVLLSFEEQKQIAQILSTADEKIELLRAKKEKYETLKKGLLQKLLSGEIRLHN